MNLNPISIFLIFINTWIVVHSSSLSHFTGDVSINCGSSDTTAARDGTEWHGDVQSFLQIKGSSAFSTVMDTQASGDDLGIPYSTTRLSRYQFSYGFRLNPGQKILRLHFNPRSYKGYKRFKDLFAVDAGPFTLLNNFSASLTARALGVNSFVKEYCINIQENQFFNVVFSPASSSLFDTFAFINGIEIISLPITISYFHGSNIGIPVVGKSPIHVDNSTALEIIRRLNLKRDFISSADDVGYMFGLWEAVPKVKPSKVRNFTWTTLVDVGFRYLVRLYLSERAESGAMIFKVSINEMLVDTNIRVLREMENEDSFIPIYVDYMVMMRGRKQEGRRVLVIWIESNVELIDGHGPFKGFEIMKLSNLEYSLVSLNPSSSAEDTSYETLQNRHMVHGGKNVIATITIIILTLSIITVYTLSQIWDAIPIGAEDKNLLSASALRLCRRFPFDVIQSATTNFSEAYVIGRDGLGKVYKGVAKLDFAREQQETRKIRTRRLLFWNRVIPSCKGSDKDNNEVEFNVLPKATEEEGLEYKKSAHEVEKEHKNVNMLPSEEDGAFEYKQTVDELMKGRNVNRLPIDDEEEDALEYEQAVDTGDELEKERNGNLLPTGVAAAEILAVTDEFSRKCWIANGSNGGSIFVGVLKTRQKAAIKRLYKTLPDREFLAQVSTIFSLKHENVVKLHGYCADGGLQIFVYEFAPHGSLHDIIHGPQGANGIALETRPALSWLKRIKIAVGAAQGLCYIHDQALVHHNIKSSNVLLFDDEIAKISDLHLSTGCSCKESYIDESHPFLFPPCFAYHPPEFVDIGHSQKGDVYSFGVVLLELLMGRKAFFNYSSAEKNLVEWATPKLRNNKLKKIVDAKLRGDYPPKAVAKVASVAGKCVEEKPGHRPNMITVLSELQIASWMTQDHLLKQQYSSSRK